MNFEESAEQLENLIESWQLNEADLNQTDIDAIKIILEENQELKKQLHEASLNIQEMTERDIYCPSSCDKLEELLKENQKLKKQLYELGGVDEFNKHLLTQQKEFVKYLENMLDDENDIFSVVRVKDVLQKYKEIIVEGKE